jgi:hypothetical protein
MIQEAKPEPYYKPLIVVLPEFVNRERIVDLNENEDGEG